MHWALVAAQGFALVAMSGGSSVVVVSRLLIAMVSLVAERRLGAGLVWLIGCRAQAQYLWRTGLVAP